FFSSRRRHTRSKRDWSSDVCSSNLGIACSLPGRAPERAATSRRGSRFEVRWPRYGLRALSSLGGAPLLPQSGEAAFESPRRGIEIGRASCREREEKGEGGVVGKKER